MHESSSQSEKQVIAIMNYSSGEHCGPWASSSLTFYSFPYPFKDPEADFSFYFNSAVFLKIGGFS